jgi:transposase
MEAGATSPHRGRVVPARGREVRPVPAASAKPFAGRQGNGRADAEAIAEAALRPTMRFAAVKSAETQGRASPIGLEPMETSGNLAWPGRS